MAGPAINQECSHSMVFDMYGLMWSEGNTNTTVQAGTHGHNGGYMFILSCAENLTKPYDVLGFGTVNITKHYNVLGFGGIDPPPCPSGTEWRFRDVMSPQD